MSCTASAGRSRFHVCEPHPLCEAFMRLRNRRAFHATTISTGRARGRSYFQLTARRGPMLDRGRPSAPGAAPFNSRSCPTPRPPYSVLGAACGRRRIPTRRSGANGPCRRQRRIAVGAFNSPQLLRLSGGSGRAPTVAGHPGHCRHAGSAPTCKITCRSACSTAARPITINDVINNFRHRVEAGCATLCSGKAARRRRGLCRGSPAPARRSRRPTCRCTSSFSAPTRSARRCTRFPASSPRFVNCAAEPRLRAHQSADPKEPPAIQPRYPLSGDRDTVVAGLKLLRRTWSSRRAPVYRRGARARAALHQRRRPAGLRARGRRDRGSIRPAPAGGPDQPLSSTSGCACAASSACAWSTVRSCPPSSPATPTPRSC